MDTKSRQDDRDSSARRTSSADSTETSSASRPASATQLLFINSPFGTTGQAHPQITQLSLTPLWRPLYVATLILVDIINMLFSLGVCSTIKPSSLISLENRIPIWQFTILQCGTWAICLLVCGTYHRHVMSEGYGLYSKIFNAGILTIIFTSCAVYMLDLQFPRTLVIAVPMLACALDVVTRWLLRRVLHSCRLHGRCQYNAVIVGSPDGIDKILSTLDSSHANGYKPIAICPVALDPRSDDGDIIAVPYHLEERQDNKTTEPKVIAFNSHFPRSVKLLGAQIVIVADVITRDNKIMRALPLAVDLWESNLPSLFPWQILALIV